MKQSGLSEMPHARARESSDESNAARMLDATWQPQDSGFSPPPFPPSLPPIPFRLLVRSKVGGLITAEFLLSLDDMRKRMSSTALVHLPYPWALSRTIALAAGNV